jgi:hypothetical protein
MENASKPFSKIRLQLVSTAYTTTVAMHHHNVVGYHGGDPFSIAGSYRVQPSLSDSSDGQNGGVDVWFWKGIHDYLL